MSNIDIINGETVHRIYKNKRGIPVDPDGSKSFIQKFS